MVNKFKKNKGAVLLATLIINGVIAILVLGCLGSQLLATKTMQAYQAKQTSHYSLMVALQDFLSEKILETDACLYQTVPQFSYPLSKSSQQWCLFKSQKGGFNQYKIWDGGLNCCLQTTEYAFAHFYYLEFKVKDALGERGKLVTVVKSDKAKACHCPNRSAINTGIIHMIDKD